MYSAIVMAIQGSPQQTHTVSIFAGCWSTTQQFNTEKSITMIQS